MIAAVILYKDHSIFFWAIICIIAPATLVFAINLYVIFKANGDWEIIVNESDFIWRTPTFSNKQTLIDEKPFQCKLSQIKKVLEKEFNHVDKTEYYYWLFLEDGEEISLNTQSNVGMKELVKTLKNKGIMYEYEQKKSNKNQNAACGSSDALTAGALKCARKALCILGKFHEHNLS